MVLIYLLLLFPVTLLTSNLPFHSSSHEQQKTLNDVLSNLRHCTYETDQEDRSLTSESKKSLFQELSIIIQSENETIRHDALNIMRLFLNPTEQKIFALQNLSSALLADRGATTPEGQLTPDGIFLMQYLKENLFSLMHNSTLSENDAQKIFQSFVFLHHQFALPTMQMPPHSINN